MSYRTWHYYGYGICVDDIKVDSTEKIEALLGHAPEYRKKVHEWFTECGVTEPSVDDYLEFDQDFYLGLATLLREVIVEAENIELFACDDFDGVDFLIYEPVYPWQMTDKDLGMTEEGVEQLFRKYVSILTDKPINIEYQDVGNGG